MGRLAEIKRPTASSKKHRPSPAFSLFFLFFGTFGGPMSSPTKSYGLPTGQILTSLHPLDRLPSGFPSKRADPSRFPALQIPLHTHITHIIPLTDPPIWGYPISFIAPRPGVRTVDHAQAAHARALLKVDLLGKHAKTTSPSEGDQTCW